MLDIEVVIKGEGVYLLKLIGTLNTETVSIFEEELSKILDESTKTIVLDMERLSYITSLGISAIIKYSKVLQDKKGKLLLANIPEHIKKVFEIIKALPTLGVCQSQEELDAYLLSMQKKIKEQQS